MSETVPSEASGNSLVAAAQRTGGTAVVLWWVPVGAGGHLVRHTSRWWEELEAFRAHRAPQPLFHSALEAWVDGDHFIIEMAPQWAAPKEMDRGVERAAGHAANGPA